jgi:hypothetical protein
VAKRERRLYTNLPAPELYAKVSEDTVDASNDELLEQWRLEYEAGYPMALNLAFMLCHYSKYPIPEWVAAALPVRLEKEVQSRKRRKLTSRLERERLRYQTVISLWRQCGTLEEAFEKAAAELGMSWSTMEKSYKTYRKRNNLPPGLPPH